MEKNLDETKQEIRALLLDDGARYRRPWTDGLDDQEKEGAE